MCERRSRNPIEVAMLAEERVISRSLLGELLRSYYGFARGRWYGGSFSGYVIGCNLNCVYCWAWFRNRYGLGSYLTPSEVVKKLITGGSRASARVLRISGGEPTIGFDHLIEVLRAYTKAGTRLPLVVETNGILLGYNSSYAGDLSDFAGRGVVVRVSIKGANPETFSTLTEAPPEFFRYQLDSVKYLINAGYNPSRDLRVAIMSSFNQPREIAELIYRLSEIDEGIAGAVELEIVRMYRSVQKRLKARGYIPYRYLN